MIHKYRLRGYNICIDVCSGAVHTLDDMAYELLDYTGENMTDSIPNEALTALAGRFEEQELRDCWAELYELYSSRQLHAPDDYQQFADKMVNATVKSMCLNVSHDCNLACEYCFAGKGGFGGKRELMSIETGKRAIDFLIEKSVGRHNLEVDFFGGEPLMNLPMVKATVEYARSLEAKHNKRFRFTITTNGLLLNDDAIQFINEEMHNCVLSIDGRREVNDRLRIDWGGNGCYDRIISAYQKLVAGRGTKDYYARATYTSYNLDFTDDILHLYELGFKNLSEEPVVTDDNLPYAIRDEHLPRIMSEYERLADKLLEMKKRGDDIHFFHYMIDLDQGPCAIRRLRGCSSGNEYIAVVPNGDIYPCHSFVGDEQWRMGSIITGEYRTDIKERFARAHIYNKPECAGCWAKFYCSGGCNSINYQKNGDMLKPYHIYCEMQKKRIECAIMMKVALAE